VTVDTFKEPSQREDAKKAIKKAFEERYTSGKNKWFFQALRVRSFIRASLRYRLTRLFSSECFLYHYAHKIHCMF
jgi:large subunit ribosomal protein L27e